jgi:hypothetical protein
MDTQDYSIKVTQVKQQNDINQLGKVVPMIIVTYTIGAHGPFTESWPKSEYNPATVKAFLQQQQQAIQQTVS